MCSGKTSSISVRSFVTDLSEFLTGRECNGFMSARKIFTFGKSEFKLPGECFSEEFGSSKSNFRIASYDALNEIMSDE
ncbi:UNVERIFIED_CONTAM: hypothetical protein PYX00_000078 [Menopon gallinae]|uniref:Uncharacterized protein n=1 Tax=Menopon gallinae TaxID=328185 RepID=A0AAW2I8Z6_9NEOP